MNNEDQEHWKSIRRYNYIRGFCFLSVGLVLLYCSIQFDIGIIGWIIAGFCVFIGLVCLWGAITISQDSHEKNQELIRQLKSGEYQANKEKNKPESRTVQNWKKGKDKYLIHFSKLPTDLAEKVFSHIRDDSLRYTGLQTKDMPDEVTWALTALTEIINKRRSGAANAPKLSADTRAKYSKAVDRFCNMYPQICMAGGISADQAMNKGLDFGIITNNAADAGLYAAMNTHEKIRNTNKAEMVMKKNMDAEVLALLEAIKSA